MSVLIVIVVLSSLGLILDSVVRHWADPPRPAWREGLIATPSGWRVRK
jgi:hypothetical protein